MTISVRELTLADVEFSLQLSVEGFGGSMPAELPDALPAGVTGYGAFDGERLIGRLSALPMRTHVPGAEVDTLGIAGVAISPEHRGAGLLDELMSTAFENFAGPVACLYPTAPGVYRRHGFEMVANLATVEIPICEIGWVRRPDGFVTRRATADDLEALTALHAKANAGRLGPIVSGSNPRFSFTEEFLESVTGVTIVSGRAGPVGYAIWDRGEGYRAETSTMTVHQFVAHTANAARALWSFFGGFATTVGSLNLITSRPDPALLELPRSPGRVIDERAYMLAVLDVPGALESRMVSADLSGELHFGVNGGFTDSVNGSYVATMSDGQIRVQRSDANPARIIQARGLATAWSGTFNSAQQRAAGLLTGPTDDDASWDAMFGTPRLRVERYF